MRFTDRILFTFIGERFILRGRDREDCIRSLLELDFDIGIKLGYKQIHLGETCTHCFHIVL